MITHLYNALVAVTDQDRALAFYTGPLGWTVRDDMMMGETDRWLTVEIPGTQTALALASGQMAGGREPGGHSGITLITDDIDGDHSRLSAAGVTFTEPIQDMPWGARGTWFQDPDANIFFVVTDGS